METTPSHDTRRRRAPASGPWHAPASAAAYLNISKATIYRLMAAREIAYEVAADGRRRISSAELDRYARSRTRKAS